MDHLLNSWVPIAYSKEVATSPIQVIVAGIQIAVWRGSNNRICAIHDRCSHRGALLSRGTIIGDHIRCPYHGLQFDGKGVCSSHSVVSIGNIRCSKNLQYFHCRDDFGVLWITRNSSALFPLSALLPLTFIIKYQISDNISCNAYDLLENLLDVAHFPFVHATTFSNPGVAVNADAVIYAETDYGFDCTYTLPIVPSGDFKSLVSAEAYEVAVVGRFIAPLTQLFYVSYNTGLKYASVQCVLPISATETRFLQFAFSESVSDGAADQALLLADHAIWLEDKAVLESIQRHVEPDWSGVRLEFNEPHSVHLAKAFRRLHQT